MTFANALEAVRSSGTFVPKDDCATKADFVRFLASNPAAALVAAQACPDTGRKVAFRVAGYAAGERILRFADAVTSPDKSLVKAVFRKMPPPARWTTMFPEWSPLTREGLLAGLRVVHPETQAAELLTEAREILSAVRDDVVWDYIWYLYSRSSPNELMAFRGVSDGCRTEIHRYLGTWCDTVRGNDANDPVFATREMRRLELIGE
nr:hypothetical protein TetV2_00576 [Oceanusvirus sp.]